mmetsp:Transcript_6147/g.13797  ORF Transcript_6147/g.13797 Transcript_6147/m.13797 type:complete len:272 (+) Transcript_6147:1256-2071(+)
METSKSDELPRVPQTAQVIVEGSNLLIIHTRSIPIEAGAQIVCQHLMRKPGLHTLCKLLRIWDARNLCFHPDEIRVRSVGTRALNTIFNSRLDLIVTFSNTAEFPIEVNGVFPAKDRVGHLSCLGVAQRGRVAGQPVLHHLLLLRDRHGEGLDLVHHRLSKCGEFCPTNPICFSSRCGGFRQGTDSRGRNSEDEGMVPSIHVGVQQSRSLGVRTGHQQGTGPEDITCQPCRNQAISVLLCGDQHLSTHMPALLGSWLLVFKMDPRSSCMDK